MKPISVYINYIIKMIKCIIKLPRMEQEIILLRTILEKSVDITKIPKATGNLRKVQLIKTTILQIVDIILKKYNLTYWLEYGTLIGAIRHKGFIPWDDDIDINILKDDYIKLPEIFDKELANTGLYYTYMNSVSPEIRVFYKDFCIDFLPVEYINKRCNTEEEKNVFHEKWGNLIDALYKDRDYNYFIKNNITHFDIMPEVDELKKKVIDKNYFQNSETKQVIRSVETMTKKSRHWAIFETDNMFPLQELEFEGIKFPAPKAPLQHLYEAKEYGEYGAVMKFPTIRDSGFGHTQAQYDNSEVDYDKILEEVKQILDNMKAKAGV